MSFHIQNFLQEQSVIVRSITSNPSDHQKADEMEMFLNRSRPGKSPADQKSNFAQTCNLLSQFLKEKRSKFSADQETTHIRPPLTTMNLLTKIEERNTSNLQCLGFLPQLVNNVDFRKQETEEPERAQMTVFYKGQMVVFNDFPADKAKEILDLATKGSSNKNGVHETNFVKPQETKPSSQAEGVLHIPQKPACANASDLPLARRASLHRFLRKRKDRAVDRAPYQVNLQVTKGSSRSGEGNSYNEEEDQYYSSKHLDLNL